LLGATLPCAVGADCKRLIIDNGCEDLPQMPCGAKSAPQVDIPAKKPGKGLAKRKGPLLN